MGLLLLFAAGVTKLARVFASWSLRRRSAVELDALARSVGGWLYMIESDLCASDRRLSLGKRASM